MIKLFFVIKEIRKKNKHKFYNVRAFIVIVFYFNDKFYKNIEVFSFYEFFVGIDDL